MTYGIARAATAPELALYRTPGKASKWRAAILQPRTIYTARVNQTFSTTDGILAITFDGGSGTLANVLADMTLLVGSTAGAWDLGICRIRSTDATHFYINETSDIEWADNLYLTVVEDFSLWAKHVLISGGVTYMDGSVAYSDQHAAPDPTPIMGSNRVLRLTGASVSTQFSWGDSYVIGGLSTISAYATSAPTAASVTGPTTATPTVTFDAAGWHPIYLTVTAANSKTYLGVRWVYVMDPDDPPPSVTFVSPPRQDVETGGWEFGIRMTHDADLDTVRDHALVIVFSEDHFGDTQSDIGPVAGSENVEVTGWIAKESIVWNPEQGSVTFTVYTAQYFFSQIPAFPDGVEFVTGTPAGWTEFQNLTVEQGLWHFLHWRTTATRVMDVFLTGDTKYTREVSSLASNLWEQLREMGWLQIYARAGCNAWNQLVIKVHPQLVPAASRTWPTVMTITKPDWQGEIDFDRITKPEVAVVSLSGVAVNESGLGSAYFSLSPGHAYPHYGAIDVQDRILVASQADANQKAGLYRGWRNNPYPEIPIPLKANIRLIDCFLQSQCAIVLATGDTPRGNAYSGNLLPTSVTIVTDPRTGRTSREVTFEAETFEDLAVDGDIPGSRADVTFPPIPSLPPLPSPALFPIIPGTIEPTVGGPKTVVVHNSGTLSKGLMYATDFNTGPHWIFFNAGLTAAQREELNFFFQTPSGACYCGKGGSVTSSATGQFLARAPRLGGTWEILLDQSVLQDVVDGAWAVERASCNPLLPDTVGLVVWRSSDGAARFLIGTGGVFADGALLAANSVFEFICSYGFGKWMITSFGNQPGGNAKLISADGMSVTASGLLPSDSGSMHKRASSTGKTFHEGPGMYVGTDNLTSYTLITDADLGVGEYFATDPTGTYCMNRYTTGSRARSSDGGSTWGVINNLPLQTNYFFAYAGGVGINSRWLAVGGSSIYYTDDFGDSWAANIGNLMSLIAVPGLDYVWVLGF